MSTTKVKQAQREITVEEAYSRFEREKKGQLRKTTLDTYRYGVNKFREWMKVEGLTLTDLDGWNVGEFGIWLRDEHDYSPSTIESYTKAARVFLKFLEKKGVVPGATAEAMPILTASKKDRRTDVEISPDRVRDILSVRRESHPANRNTIIFELEFQGLRCGEIHGLDCEDVQYWDEHDVAVIRLQDRDRTPLKGGENHERIVRIPDDLHKRIQLYEKHHRYDVTESDGREPLITTTQGRMSRSSIKQMTYKLTCPLTHGLDGCSCVKPPNVDTASKCSKSVSPHPVRAAHITDLKDKGWSGEDIKDRCACNPDVQDLHYDRADEWGKAVRRRALPL
jgi:site-specific recombinase XerD